MDKNKNFSFTNQQIEAFFNVNRKELYYWRRRELFGSIMKTDGGHCRYEFKNLVEIKTIKKFVEKGISINRLSKVVKKLRETFPDKMYPLAETSLYIVGREVIILDKKLPYDPLTGQGTFIKPKDTEMMVRKITRAIIENQESGQTYMQQRKSG